LLASRRLLAGHRQDHADRDGIIVCAGWGREQRRAQRGAQHRISGYHWGSSRSALAMADLRLLYLEIVATLASPEAKRKINLCSPQPRPAGCSAPRIRSARTRQSAASVSVERKPSSPIVCSQPTEARDISPLRPSRSTVRATSRISAARRTPWVM